NALRTASTRRSRSSASPMSAETYSTSAPRSRRASSGSPTSASARRPQRTRSNPSRASASEMPKPMPLAPPVTRATLEVEGIEAGFKRSGQRGHVEPPALLPRLQAELGELHALGAFEQPEAVRLVGD